MVATMKPKFAEKNVLVQYQGGGYDGCFWEYNYFVVTKGGNFFNVYASGINGVTTKEDAIELMNSGKNVEIIHFNNEDEIAEWSKINNASAVNRVVQIVNNKIKPKPLFWVCEKCGKKVRISSCESELEKHHHNEQGSQYCGGLVYTAEKLLCDNCIEDNTCGQCNEYSDTLKEGYCESCFDKKIDKYFYDNYGTVSFIDYDKFDNKFNGYDYTDSELYILKDDFDSCFGVKVVLKDRIHTYFVEAESEEKAIDYVEIFVGRENIFEILKIKKAEDMIFGINI